MREAKLVNSKLTKQDTELAELENSSSDSTTQASSLYQNILVYLMPEDVKFLENIVDDYWKAYK